MQIVHLRKGGYEGHPSSSFESLSALYFKRWDWKKGCLQLLKRAIHLPECPLFLKRRENPPDSWIIDIYSWTSHPMLLPCSLNWDALILSVIQATSCVWVATWTRSYSQLYPAKILLNCLQWETKENLGLYPFLPSSKPLSFQGPT